MEVSVLDEEETSLQLHVPAIDIKTNVFNLLNIVLSSFLFFYPFLFFLFLISTYWITLCSSVICPPQIAELYSSRESCYVYFCEKNKWMNEWMEKSL